VGKMTMKRLNVKVNEETYNYVSEQATKRGLTMNAIVVLALETYAQQNTVIANLPELMRIYNEQQQKDKE
jgi:alpha-D-ribose 1-methylphosphonate 5-triphosphate synthase subunit PhnG